jgi:lipopolysaccharide transport system permease protein
LIRRDFVARFRGSALGWIWAILHPAALIALYWLVFTRLIPRSVAAVDDSYSDFLITGLIPWLAFNEALIRSMTSIVDNGPVVRKLALRSELIVAVPTASAIVLELIALAIFATVLIARGQLPSMIWLLPFAVAIQIVLQLGVGWILSVIYLFFRDLGQIVGFLLAVFFYLSPVLYRVTPGLERVFAWNPMTPLLGLYRSALLSEALPAAPSIVFLLIVASVMFFAGVSFFRREQGTLSDVI